MYNVPDDLDEALDWGEKEARTIGWLGIYALHDAAAAFFQAGDSIYDAEGSKYVASAQNFKDAKSATNVDGEAAEIKSGLTTDHNYTVGGQIFKKGAPVSTVIRALDKIGRV